MIKRSLLSILTFIMTVLFTIPAYSGFTAHAFQFFGKKVVELTPVQNRLTIPVTTFSNGKAHFFKVKADDGTMVTFFALKSKDGIIRAAIDACDVCYRSGKGYKQEGDFMVCQNCGQKFASNKINLVKGGCNPAPLKRTIQDGNLVILMNDINSNSWYCEYKS